MKEMVGGCCVCSDERGWPDNPLVYCDGNGCTVAVHQACYGIVTVPTGPWYCRKCESPETKGKVRCELCPSRSGALKRTDTGGWAHVVCALYIPEVRFGNVTSMEPIVLRLIPPERYNKTCYICQDMGKPHRATAGACMQCNKSGCKQQFHVTCAQSLGLLCEEAGNYLDNVKYCGYCQHHYSKLFTNHEVTVIAKKKGGNVKTIPPYKPVSHDSQSSDSSGEKERDPSPMASGSGTPTHATKSKGPGRKSSHGNNTSGKSTPSSGKATSNPQPMDTNEEASETQPVSRKHKSSGDKHKKKSSPARRGSSTGEGGSGSKASTPAPSPQHSTDTGQSKGSGNTTPASVAPPAASPTSKSGETSTVISSVASSAASGVITVTAGPSTSTAATTTVVQTLAPTVKLTTFQESVITNTDAMDTKHTKKRKAMAAANAAAEFAAQAAAAAAAVAAQNAGDLPPPQAGTSWEQQGHTFNDAPMETSDKVVVKKAKTELEAAPTHFTGPGPHPPPPPTAASPASQPSPRLLHSPMPGPSGMNPPPAVRSPSQHQGAKSERDGHASLLVSVPLLSTSYGFNISPHLQFTKPAKCESDSRTKGSVPLYLQQVSAITEMQAPSHHIFHQPQKQAAMESSIPGHPAHAVAQRAWAGLNVAYEMQQEQNKPGISGVAGSSKDIGPMAPLPPANIRNKKRQAMAASAVAMANTPMTTIQLASTSTQSLASIRRQPQATPPPPIYHETIKDSPPSSPSSERPLKPKPDIRMSAPHMLGNELNPDSGAAARLQEQLSAELAAHAAGSVGPDPLVPPPLINKAVPGGSGGGRSSSAQSLDQLLERQWEQGSQFLMEQAQHFDIASLLSCLHQLRTENVRLEEHVANLLQRRDHLLAVNARLAIPLTAASAPPPDPPRCPRENGSQIRPPPPSVRTTETITSDRSHQLVMREVQQKPS